MTSTFLTRAFRYVVIGVLGLTFVLLMGFAWNRSRLRAESGSASISESKPDFQHSEWPGATNLTEMEWGGFAPTTGGLPEADHSNAKSPYRLAGTFFNEDIQGRQIRQAVLDDVRKKDQRIVSEGDTWDDVRMESIFVDHVVLIRSGLKEEIWLSMATLTPQAVNPQSDPNVTNAAGGVEIAIGTNRFGSQISEYRWVFKREALMDYARSVAEDSVRMAQLFDSLKPIYDERSRIRGYELESQGENDFFKDVGLKESDRIQKVNGMPMSNRRRAEFFISEFTNNRMNVFVLDVERNGQTQKLIYQLQ